MIELYSPLPVCPRPILDETTVQSDIDPVLGCGLNIANLIRLVHDRCILNSRHKTYIVSAWRQ